MKHIVFDFGGVVFDWNPARMLQRELPLRAHDAASTAHWVKEFFQTPGGGWADFDRGTVTVPALVERIAARTGLAAAEVQRVVDGVPRELQPIPDTVDLLRRLHGAGHALHFLSNMPQPYAGRLEREHGFLAWFRSGVFSGREKLMKPEAAIFELAALRFGRAPQELVFLDDHAPNVIAAQTLGWNGLVFQNAAQAEAEMRQRGWLA